MREFLMGLFRRWFSRKPTLPPSQPDPRGNLKAYAQEVADRMAREGRLKHSSSSWMQARGIRAENIAYGQATEEQVMEDWMNSKEGHRENLLRFPIRAVASADSGSGQLYWAAVFRDS